MSDTLLIMRPAVFLDRDGVLNVYLPEDYVKTPEELVLLPHVAEAVRRFNEAGYPVFVISNQQGVSKGVMTDADLTAIDAALHARLAAEHAFIQRSYYCTARASENHPDRKPNPGMILRAAADHHLDLSNSVFIGDTETDAQAARAAGVGKFILTLTGKYPHADVASDISRFPVAPDYVAKDLFDAAHWVLNPQNEP